MDIPRDLVEQIAHGNAVLFVGAGLSMGAGLPGWVQLLTPLADEIGLSPDRRADLLQVAQFYKNQRGRQALLTHILEQLDTTGKHPTENHSRLLRLGIRTWITTNYDDLLEQTLREASERFSVVVHDEDLPYTSHDAVTVVKLHGDRAQPNTLVITQTDYNTYLDRIPLIKKKLDVLLAQNTFFFVGYSIADPDLNQIKDRIGNILKQHERMAYALLFDADEIGIQDLRARNIHVLGVDVSAVPDISERLSSLLDDFISEVDPLRGSPAAQMGRSLDLLASFMEKPEVRDIVVAFRTDFRTTRDQIQILNDYKELHDALHDLQFRCFNAVVRDVGKFPEESAAFASLMDHRQTFQEILGRVQTVAERQSVQVPPKLIQELEGALVKLNEAIDGDKAARAPLDDACGLVRHVLTKYPSLFSARLFTAVEALRLRDMCKDMDLIRQKLQENKFGSDQVALFQEGVESLAKFQDRLAELVKEHNKWQEIDNDFRTAENQMMVLDLEEAQEYLRGHWPTLKADVAPLYTNQEADWAKALARDGANLDSALESQNPNKSKVYFDSYRQGVADRFFNVDKDLKRKCGQLSDIAEPLDKVLGMLKGARA